MLACNCTLVGSDACKACSNFIKEFKTEWEKYNDIWYWTYGQFLDSTPTINYPFISERYELVEKKDWKLNQLKKQLEEKKQSSEYYSKVIDKEINYLAELNKEIEQLESEINQLEEKKE